MPTIAQREVPADEAPPAPRSRATRRARWIGGSALLALAGWSAVGLAEYALDRVRDDVAPPPVQLAAIVGQAARAGFHVVESRTVDFQGTDSPARVLVLRPDRRGSDELRILEIRGDRLVRAFRFQPEAAGARAGVRVRVVDVADLDANGSEELVVALTVPAIDSLPDDPHVVRHVALGLWDWLRGEYVLVPLLGRRLPAQPAPLRVARVDAVVPPERKRRTAYTTPARIVDAASGTGFVSYGVEGFRLRTTPAGSFLDAWFLLQRPTGAESAGTVIGDSGQRFTSRSRTTHRRGLMHVRVWRVRPWRLDAPLYACDLAGAIVRLEFGPDPEAVFRRTAARDVAPFCA